MKKYYFIVLVAVCFVLSFFQGSSNAAPPTANVNVVNTPNVNVSNTPNVNVSNTPNVIVGNGSTSPVPVKNVENPDKSAYIQFCQATIKIGNLFETCNIDVPAGKRVFIEFVGASCYNSDPHISDTFPAVYITTPGGPSNIVVSWYLFPLENPLSPSISNIHTATRMVKLFAQPSSDFPLNFRFHHTATNDAAYCDGIISGYLVDLP